MFKAFSDERRLDAVEELVPLAAEAGLPMTHLAMSFAITHPTVTSAITDVGTLDQAYVPPAIQRPSLRRRRAAV